MDNNETVTISEILQRIDMLIASSGHIEEAMKTLNNLKESDNPAFGAAISDAVRSKEETNRQILKFLVRMYDDLKGTPDEGRGHVLDHIGDILVTKQLDPDNIDSLISVYKEYLNK